jgi:hypothetical protein
MRIAMAQRGRRETRSRKVAAAGPAPAPAGPLDTSRTWSARPAPAPLTGSPVDRVRQVPRPDRPADLTVRAPSHQAVRTAPWTFVAAGAAHQVRIADSTSVVLGDSCVLRERDHYHVRRLTVAPMPVLPPAAVAALARLAADPADESAVSTFQAALLPLCEPAARVREPGQVRVHLPANCRRVVDHSVGVVVGDCARVNAEHRYVLDESVLHLPELLVRSRGLVRAYARAVAEPGAGERAFLARLVHEAGGSSADQVLAAARGTPAEETTLFALFGVLTVDGGSGVMVGVDNEIRSSFTVVPPSARAARVLTGLPGVRGQADRYRQERPPRRYEPRAPTVEDPAGARPWEGGDAVADGIDRPGSGRPREDADAYPDALDWLLSDGPRGDAYPLEPDGPWAGSREDADAFSGDLGRVRPSGRQPEDAGVLPQAGSLSLWGADWSPSPSPVPRGRGGGR